MAVTIRHYLRHEHVNSRNYWLSQQQMITTRCRKNRSNSSINCVPDMMLHNSFLFLSVRYLLSQVIMCGYALWAHSCTACAHQESLTILWDTVIIIHKLVLVRWITDCLSVSSNCTYNVSQEHQPLQWCLQGTQQKGEIVWLRQRSWLTQWN